MSLTVPPTISRGIVWSRESATSNLLPDSSLRALTQFFASPETRPLPNGVKVLTEFEAATSGVLKVTQSGLEDIYDQLPKKEADASWQASKVAAGDFGSRHGIGDSQNYGHMKMYKLEVNGREVIACKMGDQGWIRLKAHEGLVVIDPDNGLILARTKPSGLFRGYTGELVSPPYDE